MDSPHIGSKDHKDEELLYISTDKMDIIIKGSPFHPTAKSFHLNEDICSKIWIECEETGMFHCFGYDGDIMFSGQEKRIIAIAPLFFEHQNYQIVIEPKMTRDSISFWHENPLLRDAVDYVGKRKKLLMGLLNFGSEIGYSDLLFMVNGEEYLTVNIEVFPSKLDYKEDYIQILKDINEEIYNLAFDFLKKTYLEANLNEEIGNSPTEFWSILQFIFHKFIQGVDLILRMSHHILQCREEILPAHKVKKYNQKSIHWIQRNPKYVGMIDGKCFPQKMLGVQKTVSYDTFENRMIKHILNLVIRKLSKVQNKYTKLKRRKDDAALHIMEQMKKQIRQRANVGFLSTVGTLHTTNVLSLVMNMAPGYKDVYKYYLMMMKGLSLEGEIFKISSKNLAELYEYWCFIKLNSLLKKKYALISQNIIQAEHNGLFVRLKKGQQAKMEYFNPCGGEKFHLLYNRSYKNLPTGTQKPDTVLSLMKENSKVEYKYIFDAKYRINGKREGPEEEDINAMHRYRDAIVQANKENANYEKMVFGAYVLFPYHNEQRYVFHPFYESIQKVNVGGFPFLPTATSLVENFLEELIEDSAESAFERSTLSSGTLEYIEKVNFDGKEALVGAVRNVMQLKINIEQKFYHIPYDLIKLDPAHFRYIALYQKKELSQDGQGGIWYYGEIRHWEMQKRGAFSHLIKMTRNNPDDLYVLFRVNEWRKLDHPIRPKGFGVRSRVYTNYYLLKHAQYLPELCIRSKEEYRLLLELKRLVGEIEVTATEKHIDQSKIDKIYFKNIWITIEQDNILVYNQSFIRSYPISEFQKYPTSTIKEIKKQI